MYGPTKTMEVNKDDSRQYRCFPFNPLGEAFGTAVYVALRRKAKMLSASKFSGYTILCLAWHTAVVHAHLRCSTV